jgi:hypothetical protein
MQCRNGCRENNNNRGKENGINNNGEEISANGNEKLMKYCRWHEKRHHWRK